MKINLQKLKKLSSLDIFINIIFIVPFFISFNINLIKPLWLDEIASIYQVNVQSIKILIQNFFNGSDTNPPLYFIMLFFLTKIFSINVTLLKITSLLFVIISFSILQKLYWFKTNRFYFNVIFISSPFLMYYLISELRAYSLILFLASILFSELSNNYVYNTKEQIKISIIITLLLYTHYFSIFYAIPVIIILIYKNIEQHNYSNLLLNLSPILLYFLWIPAIINQYSVFFGHTWQPIPTFRSVLLIPKYFFGKIIVFLIPIFVYIVIKHYKDIIFTLKKIDSLIVFVMICWSILPFIIAIFSVFTKVPFVERYFTISIIPFLILLTFILSISNSKVLSYFVFIICIGSFIFNSIKFYEDNTLLQKQLQKRLNYLNQKDMVCESPHVFYPMNFYKIENMKFNVFYALDYESAIAKGNLKNSLFDYYGNLNLKKYFNLKNVCHWDSLKSHLRDFYLINESNRMFFEFRIVPDSSYKIIKIDNDIYRIIKIDN